MSGKKSKYEKEYLKYEKDCLKYINKIKKAIKRGKFNLYTLLMKATDVIYIIKRCKELKEFEGIKFDYEMRLFGIEILWELEE